MTSTFYKTIRHNMHMAGLSHSETAYISSTVAQWMKHRSTDPQVPSSNAAGNFVFMKSGKLILFRHFQVKDML